VTGGRIVDVVVDLDTDSEMEFDTLSMGKMFFPLGSL